MSRALDMDFSCTKDVRHIWSHLCWRRDSVDCFNYECTNWECSKCKSSLPKNYKSMEDTRRLSDDLDIPRF